MQISRKLPKDYDKRFAKLDLIIEATDFEKRCLLRNFTVEKRDYYLGDIKEDSSGLNISISKDTERSINLSMWFVDLYGVRCCFYTPTSELVDYKVINDFISKNFKKVKKESAEDLFYSFEALYKFNYLENIKIEKNIEVLEEIKKTQNKNKIHI